MDARTETSPSEPIDAIAPRACTEDALERSILSSLSQEFCRQLFSLRAGCDLLLAEKAPPISSDQRGHVQTMISLCDDLLRLTRSSLDYAGLVQGSRSLWFGTFTVGALIREIDRQFESTAASRKIAWECALEGEDATVTTDASLCQQIFANILANALSYTPAGGHVRVAGRVEGRQWIVSVSDDGPGIPPDELKRVFVPYYRLSRDGRSRLEGNGLGLPISREMVGRLGGEIGIHSNLGQGTRVTVRFPRDATPEQRAP